jgi:hypothetical protein
MFKLYFLTSVGEVVASVTLNYQLIRNSLEFEFFFFNFFFCSCKYFKAIGILKIKRNLFKHVNRL